MTRISGKRESLKVSSAAFVLALSFCRSGLFLTNSFRPMTDDLYRLNMLDRVNDIEGQLSVD